MEKRDCVTQRRRCHDNYCFMRRSFEVVDKEKHITYILLLPTTILYYYTYGCVRRPREQRCWRSRVGRV